MVWWDCIVPDFGDDSVVMFGLLFTDFGLAMMNCLWEMGLN